MPEIQPNFWFYWFTFCGIIMGGYFAAASGIYWLLYPVLSQKSSWCGSRQKTREAISRDIKLSVLSGLFFALGAACFMVCYDLDLTQVYTQWKLQDLGYITFSYILVLCLQDTYFYFTHRLFHLPLLFKRFHQGHHLSKPPTPWTFFALEPVEAATQSVFLLGLTFVIPLHLGVLVAILVTMAVWAMGNHLGFQVVPFSQTSRWWGKWLIGSTHHLVHHRQLTQHFGLYFTFWDKVLGTQNDHYNAEPLQHRSQMHL